MTRLRTCHPSIYFVFHIIERYFPDSNTITEIRRYNDRFWVEVQNKQGESYLYREIRTIQDPELRLRAYLLDFLMRLAGQGGRNVVISDGKCYTNWTRFNRDILSQVNVVKYNQYDQVVIGSLYVILKNIQGLIFDVQEIYKIDLAEFAGIVEKIWKY